MNELESGKRVVFTRWGDGEWEVVLGAKTEADSNVDGHQYFKSLTLALRDVLIQNPHYYFGMQNLAYYKVMGRRIDRFLKQHQICRSWLNADAFHYASEFQQFPRFVNHIKGKTTLLVGPIHLRSLKLFPFEHLEIPSVNCWLQKDQILTEIENRCKTKEYDLIIFCAGMAANWFVDILSKNIPASLLDLGSVFDPYTGKMSRGYHTRVKGLG